MANYVPQYMAQPVVVTLTDPITGDQSSYTADPVYCLTPDSANQLAALFAPQGLVGRVEMGSPAGWVSFDVTGPMVPYVQFELGERKTDFMNAGVQANWFNHGYNYAYAFTGCLSDIMGKLG